MPTGLFRPFQRIAISSLPSALRSFHSTSPNMVVHNVRSAEEFNTIIKEKPFVLVDAFATWCGPCKTMAPALLKHSEDSANKGIHFIKIDVDELPDVSQELNIRSMPTFIIFNNGKRAQEVVGANLKGLRNLVETVAPEALEEVTKAEEAKKKAEEAKKKAEEAKEG
ncbi:thioredoxin [Colletotrichum orchidophilum]|uniref:Thioredoxin n=1 Tax=Colletotrichum orchidophilum TaxID=1209926 RepID=A0A1G4BGM6_9PEZI|nr:thioredoxin [Colletotrichum orchidophilum]OHF00498.1 thioredoxin [Colletotrichum orchidophilum]